ncbi:MAG: hypothetical protein Q9195_006591 [Heterodermia aff. obscurata]
MPSHEEGIGYGRLASTLALDKDLCMFRHFAELNIRNILYLQSELQELELKLQRLDVDANSNTNDSSKWSTPRSYHYASRTKTTGLDREEAYWDTVLRIRDVLERYKNKADLALHLDKALRNEAWLQMLKTPSRTSWSTVRGFINAHRTLISEADAKYITAENLDDLVHLAWNKKEAMSVLIEKHMKKFFKKRDNRFNDQTIGFVSDEKVTQVVRLLAISISSVLPILSIVVLYVINHAAVRLGVIIIFSVLCSLALATLTNARNVEILATTAATKSNDGIPWTSEIIGILKESNADISAAIASNTPSNANVDET